MATTGYTAPPSAATIAGQVTTDHGAGSYVDSGLPSVPSVTDINTKLTTEHGAGSWVDSGLPVIPTKEEIAAAVLDEPGIGHTGLLATNLDAKVSDVATDTRLQLIEKILRNKMTTNPTNGMMTIYDDNNIDILLQGQLFQDVAGTTIYQDQGSDRRDRLT